MSFYWLCVSRLATGLSYDSRLLRSSCDAPGGKGEHERRPRERAGQHARHVLQGCKGMMQATRVNGAVNWHLGGLVIAHGVSAQHASARCHHSAVGASERWTRLARRGPRAQLVPLLNVTWCLLS